MSKFVKGVIGGFVLLFSFNIFAADIVKNADGTVNVVQLNDLLKQKGAKWTAKENQFSKMTAEERQFYLGALISTEQLPEKQVRPSKDLPTKFDWRNKDGINWMTPIRNQGQCGSCWAFSVVGVLEPLINIGENNPDLDYNLSEQTLVTCSGAGSCGGGYPYKAFAFLQSTGVPTEACDPYTASDDGCSRCATWQDEVKKISGYSSVSGANLKTVLLENPLSVTMEVYEDFWYYDGGIYSYEYGGFAGNHAIVLIGWDDANSCWIARNSWGTGWGEGGYFRISYSNGAAFPGAPLDADYLPSSAVVVTAPNGGETWIKENVHTIRWTCGVTDNLNIDLYKGGVFNSTIASSVSNTGTYDWNIPAGLTNASDYKVRVTRVSEPSIYDESDNNFTITVPNITITAPNGGEDLVGGNYFSIRWTSAGITGNVNIELYKGGVFNSTIVSNIINSGTYTWNIPTGLTVGSDYKVRITSISTPSIWDESDNNFNITVSSITVSAPNGGESWATGNTSTITWSSVGISGYVKIDLYKGGVLNSTIRTSASNTGSYNWTIPTSQALGADYKVKISSVSEPSLYDESDADFSIVGPTITVTSPNGGEDWFAGNTKTITWTSSGLSGYVRIHLYKGGVFKATITNCVSNTGSYNWAIPAAQATGTDYKVRVISYSNAAVYDESDANFTISGPTIAVTSPNGGESWGRGNTYPVTWNSAGVSGNVKIELYKGGSFKMTIIYSTANTGSYDWTIPAAQATGTDYKIKVTSASNISLYDFSDNNFSIIVPTTDITVTSPNGGENWTAGTAHNITWTSSGITGNVKIELYKGGALNSTIASDVSNSGTYSWNVPSSAGTDYKVRITSISSPSIYDESNTNFTITVPTVGITVTSPNGGENWVTGTNHSVTWTSSGVSGNVNVDLYKGGVFNASIASNIADGGSYSWTISAGQALGADYKVRVTNISDTSIWDESNANFSITGPNITVTSPNGGEEWLAGSSHSITWTSGGVSGNVNVDLYKGGVFSNTIASNISNTGTYSWAIPSEQIIGVDYRVRITSISDTSVWDESNADFSVTVSGTGITVTSPNGGETWVGGTTDTIRWTSSGVTENVKIELYKGGSFKLTIATSAPNTGEYVWSISSAQAAGTDYKVKITSVYNFSITDQSDNDFTIVGPSITVASPNGGESWATGGNYNILWGSAGVSGNVIIDLYKGGAFKLRIASNVANTGSYNWTVPSTQTTGTDYKIKVMSYSSSSVYDFSDNDFSIGTSSSSITVTSPNGGEDWTAGTAHNITWTSSGITGNVKIELYKGGALNSTIASDVSNSGTYSWNVPSSAGTDYKVRITSISSPSIYDESNTNFTITVPTVGITVTSPNGGENWVKGSAYDVTWTSSGISGNVNIDLYKGGALNGSIASNISNSGTYNWAIPSGQTEGADYRVRVTSVSDTSVKDESNANFSITGPNITVTSPNGGEEWLAGSSHSITWTSGGISGTVNIDLYKGGVFNSSIVSGTSNSGTYSWAIPSGQAEGADYKVRVTSVSDTSIKDESNANFSVTVGAGITVLSPNGGETWVGGTADTIRWTSSGVSGNVKIELYKGGSFKLTIATSAPNTGEYIWSISAAQAVGTDYKVKITNVYDLGVYDFSDNDFTIVGPSITVASPNGGENWVRGSSYDILWSSAGVSGNVIIDLYKAGSFKLRIASNITNTGTYSWAIPADQLTGTDYTVKVTSYSSSSINDFSDANFSILSAKQAAEMNIMIKDYALYPAYPNPATSFIRFSYQLPEKGNVSLKIYDKSGRIVKTLIDEEKASGYYETEWNMKDDAGKALPSGIYLYKFSAGGKYNATKKIVL